MVRELPLRVIKEENEALPIDSLKVFKRVTTVEPRALNKPEVC